MIEGDNLQALYLLEKTHLGKIDCIYIDPPYNSGAHDWKYNNNYVDATDTYKHSKWLSLMKSRLSIAKRLLNPKESVLICTIDEKEYLHIGCLLEEMFPESNIQMIDTMINPKGVAQLGFSRSDEYIFFVMNGTAHPERLNLGSEWSPSPLKNKISSSTKIRVVEPGWTSMMRRGTHSSRSERENLYYPIYVNPNTKTIEKIGNPIEKEKSRGEEIEGLVQVLPLRKNGDEGCWQVGNEELSTRIKQGRIRVGSETSYGFVINYLSDGEYKKILKKEFKVEGYREDGSIIAHAEVQDTSDKTLVAPTQWKISSHNASEYGSTLLRKFLPGRKFPFPKSLYAVRDTLRLFVSSKPNATILDFFAGSGTTAHAVNLLNAEDGGRRKWILVTNNEVSEDEEKDFIKKGIQKGSPEWESKGIARNITWPRILSSIEGIDANGNPLEGTYGCDSESFVEFEGDVVDPETGKRIRRILYKKEKRPMYPELNRIKLSDGMICNVKYFRCDWTPRKPEDYLLSNVLCLHIREMIELQNAIEVDGVKNVLLLNKDDIKRCILDPVQFDKVERIWINQNIILSSEELSLLNIKGYTFIPRDFFSQELKEVAE